VPNRDLTAEGIKRQRADIALDALSELDNYAPLAKAKREVARRMEPDGGHPDQDDGSTAGARECCR
jgi:hypothetical protein